MKTLLTNVCEIFEGWKAQPALLLALTVSSLFVFPLTSAHATLLTNGSAENGQISPWIPTANGSGINDSDAANAIRAVKVAQDNKPLNSIDGNWFFSFSEVGASNTGNQFMMSQTGVLPTNATLLSLSGHFANEYDDFGTVSLFAYDSTNHVLAEVSIGNLKNNQNGDDFHWTMFSTDLALPAAAIFWGVKLTGELVTGGSINVYWDNLSLTYQSVPEPGTMALLVIGFVSAAITRRRVR